MCGIVGIVSRKDVVSELLKALARLEYRGYDSSGIATINKAKLYRRRSVGKLMKLRKLVKSKPISGYVGIGHTRWATHGIPNEENAHPHVSGPVSVVHNGIIENYGVLKRELERLGQQFESETDTEVIAQLCSHHLMQGLSHLEAAKATLSRLEGAFAICFIFQDKSDFVLFSRSGSPLVIGFGENQNFVASDSFALLPMTNRVTYLEEGDWGILTASNIKIFDKQGTPVLRKINIVDNAELAAGKGNFRHYMIKEIAEQPSVIANSINQYIIDRYGEKLIELPKSKVDFGAASRLVLVGCGTAFYACATAKYWFESLVDIPVEIDLASEFRYRTPPFKGNEVVIFVSQSGETADTLASLRYSQGRAAAVVAVVNVLESSLAREADLILPIRAGVEIGVASTKAFTSQLVVLLMLAIKVSRIRKVCSVSLEKQSVENILKLPRLILDVLKVESKIKKIARNLAAERDVLFLGRGSLYPIALEGALKLKEVSYIHAEGYASGELKHGPIALIDENMPVICLSPSGKLLSKSASNIEEVKARGGKIIIIADKAAEKKINCRPWQKIIVPSCEPLLLPFVYSIPVQLVAYHTAVQKGTDVDQPRNLAKSVTVE